jgi:hypothetical protein
VQHSQTISGMVPAMAMAVYFSYRLPQSGSGKSSFRTWIWGFLALNRATKSAAKATSVGLAASSG